MRVSSRFLAPLLGLLGLLVLTPDAGARPTWCKRDPVVQIGGQTADVLVSSYEAMNGAATGPVAIVVTVPTGVAAVLRATDAGFGGWGYDVRFAESDALRNTSRSLQVRVEVYAPATDALLPVKVQFTPRGTGRLSGGSASGTANSWVVLTTR